MYIFSCILKFQFRDSKSQIVRIYSKTLDYDWFLRSPIFTRCNCPMITLSDRVLISSQSCPLGCARLILKLLVRLLPFLNHWLSLHCDWLSAVRFIHESHYLLRIIFSANENVAVKQNNQSDFKTFLK